MSTLGRLRYYLNRVPTTAEFKDFKVSLKRYQEEYERCKKAYELAWDL